MPTASSPRFQTLRELASLIQAGVSPLDAWVRHQQEHNGNLAQARKHRSMGTPLHDLLLREKLLTPSQAHQLAIATSAGTVDICLRELARESEQRHFRWQRFRARLWMSFGILGVGALAGLAVTLADGDRGIGHWLGDMLRGVVPVWLVVSVTRRLASRDSLWWAALYWHSPVKLTALKQVFELVWYRLLQAQLAAGRDAASSLQAMTPLINHRGLQQQLRRAARSVAQGDSLHGALTRSGLVTSHYLDAALRTGEGSGTLSDSLDWALRETETRLSFYLDRIERFWPRVLYVLALIGAAQMIPVTQPMGPSL